MSRRFPSLRRVVSLPLACAAGASISLAAAFAQQSGSSNPDQDDADRAPGDLVILPDEEGDIEPVLIRERINNRDWTIRFRVTLLPSSDYDRYLETDPFERYLDFFNDEIDLDSAVIVLSWPDDSAYADVYENSLRGELSIDRREKVTPRTLDKYQSGQRLAAFDLSNVEARGIRAQIEYEITAFETDIDEERARTFPWPTEPYTDPVLVSSLAPQMFVEADDRLIRRLVNEWTNNQPKKVPPYVLAKYLAGKVMEYYRFTDGVVEPFSFDRGPGRTLFFGPFFEGFRVRGAAEAARLREGSPYDMANLLCAVYRAAGIPARLVIGYDTRNDLRRDFTGRPFHAWVEFWLQHPDTHRGEWIPVDVVSQREATPRAPGLDRKWLYFGRNDDAEHYAPIAHHWKPPTAVITAGAPGLWSWLPDTESGEIPVISAAVSVTSFGTPLRRSDENYEQRQRNRSIGGGDDDN